MMAPGHRVPRKPVVGVRSGLYAVTRCLLGRPCLAPFTTAGAAATPADDDIDRVSISSIGMPPVSGRCGPSSGLKNEFSFHSFCASLLFSFLKPFFSPFESHMKGCRHRTVRTHAHTPRVNPFAIIYPPSSAARCDRFCGHREVKGRS